MKIKYLKNLSFFFSILFLLFITILITLTIIISYKPLNLTLLIILIEKVKYLKK